MEETEEVETGLTSLEEVLDEAHLMEMKDEDKYLGDIIMNNGKNTKNIKSRRDKGELQLQPYLRPGMETNLQKKFLFQLRARMIDLKANF